MYQNTTLNKLEKDKQIYIEKKVVKNTGLLWKFNNFSVFDMTFTKKVTFLYRYIYFILIIMKGR